MAYIKVTSEELRLYKDSLENICKRINEDYGKLVFNLSDIDSYLECSNNAEIKRKIDMARETAENRFKGIEDHIRKLEEIALEYENAERMNVDELNDGN